MTGYLGKAGIDSNYVYIGFSCRSNINLNISSHMGFEGKAR